MSRECVWPINLDDCCEALEEPIDPDGELVTRVLAAVSSMMSRWSGYSIGRCAETVRPLGICPECRGWCCGGADSIRLTTNDGSPVYDVTEVRVDGEAVPDDEWYFDAAKGMLWADGSRWPTRDARNLPDTEPGTFAVDVLTGSEPDGWAMWVATQLACELVRSCAGDAECRIPRNATQISSQGITIQLSDEEIQHFLPEVSSWVSAVNPRKATIPAAIFSPEVSRAKRGDNRRSRRVLAIAGSGGGCCGS